MNILIPVLGFGKAGGYRVLSKFADELIRIGHNVDMLCPDGGDVPYYPTLALVKWINTAGDIIGANNKIDTNKENAFSIQKKLSRALLKIPKKNYDIIIANHSLTVIPILRAGWKFKTLYYVQAYEPEMYKIMGGIKHFILALIAEQTYKKKLFTVVNAEIYLHYKKLKASRVLYPGIDFDIFYPKKNIQSKNKIIIGTVGRSERFKGTQYIIEAYQLLKNKYPLVELHVAFGDPADFTQMKDVYCIQPHGDDALADFYRSLDYYFCAGFFQLGGFHYPNVEAMSCGVTVITTPYYPANIDNAWLVKANNVEEFINKFCEAQGNPALRQKKIEQALIDVKQFNWKKSGEKLNIYLEELITIQKLRLLDK